MARRKAELLDLLRRQAAEKRAARQRSEAVEERASGREEPGTPGPPQLEDEASSGPRGEAPPAPEDEAAGEPEPAQAGASEDETRAAADPTEQPVAEPAGDRLPDAPAEAEEATPASPAARGEEPEQQEQHEEEGLDEEEQAVELEEGPAAPGPGSEPGPRETGSRPRLAGVGGPAPQRGGRPSPLLPLLAVVLVATPLVFWLAQQFGESAADAGGEESGEVRIAAEDGGGAETGGPAAAGERPFSVLLITYSYTDRNHERAIELTEWLGREGFRPVLPLGTPPDDPEHIQLFVGENESEDSLVALRDELRQLRPPWLPEDERPFETAIIRRLPRY